MKSSIMAILATIGLVLLLISFIYQADFWSKVFLFFVALTIAFMVIFALISIFKGFKEMFDFFNEKPK
jgi:hypothetical protein